MSNLPKILCVDDEPNVLDGLNRVLFSYFDVTTATSGKQGLRYLDEQDFSVIISDMRMPEMNGAQFLSHAKEKSPDTVRLLLTGHSDVDSAIAAVNEGNIFRFLFKPCPEKQLIGHLNDAVRMHRLVMAEKELLENTLKGAVDVLMEVLSMVAPDAFSRASHVRNYVAHMVKETNQKETWEFEIAAMLSQIGSIVLPPDVIKKAFSALPLNDEEKAMVDSTPAAGGRLLAAIPRLEHVALMIEAQRMDIDFSVSKLPANVELGARMLRIANFLDRIIVREKIGVQKALPALGSTFTQPMDKTLILSLNSLNSGDSESIRNVRVRELTAGMILDDDVVTSNGGVVLRRGQKLNGPLIDRLINFAKGANIREPIRVITVIEH